MLANKVIDAARDFLYRTAVLVTGVLVAISVAVNAFMDPSGGFASTGKDFLVLIQDNIGQAAYYGLLSVVIAHRLLTRELD